MLKYISVLMVLILIISLNYSMKNNILLTFLQQIREYLTKLSVNFQITIPIASYIADFAIFSKVIFYVDKYIREIQYFTL